MKAFVYEAMIKNENLLILSCIVLFYICSCRIWFNCHSNDSVSCGVLSVISYKTVLNNPSSQMAFYPYACAGGAYVWTICTSADQISYRIRSIRIALLCSDFRALRISIRVRILGNNSSIETGTNLDGFLNDG